MADAIPSPTQDEPLPRWRPLLRGALERQGRSPQARWLQLASLAADGTPRVRTLVFRCWSGAVALDLLTDRRSAKSGELKGKAALELCWVLPKARCQFRLRGHRLPLAGEEEQQALDRHWLALTPRGRALWGWPTPGEPLQADAPFPRELDDSAPRPEHFELLRVQLQRVELLELLGHPHRRRCWRAASDWQEEWLNP
ncbi:pyridoxamine 5'-phosphate oxidase [Cyanobium sp. Cruz CV13-4-11]|jgi:pyridoxamine 5'-phosphate oxidase|uniref:pyridoxamine 5'-phosphate oxidase n=1 Tax=unclassified Cyanobium TaxID=2627006 RepID=UPI0020CE8087|nr:MULTISPECIES: pyridoxamine 5'-phosphate oxidase [unclassified Cyanobium]MCP9900906.1 pyridoxamine 5'-phosphate oxidase [Cyanobium sp. Cruz CV11-17]MCP9919072.1 pyridoxamine 5'-phosphate oxidase [Cyanobium sp. Cruz CV13-4-11]